MIVRAELPDGYVEVTFVLPEDAVAQRANVVGDFNGWSQESTPMSRTRDGYQARVVVAPGRRYRFRYLVDGDRWHNDWEADDYVDNDFGGSDSVLDLS